MCVHVPEPARFRAGHFSFIVSKGSEVSWSIFLVGKSYACCPARTTHQMSCAPDKERRVPGPAGSLGKNLVLLILIRRQFLSSWGQRPYSLPSLQPYRLFKWLFLLGGSFFWNISDEVMLMDFSPFFLFQARLQQGHHVRETAQMFCLLEPSRHNRSTFKVVVKEKVEKIKLKGAVLSSF